MNEKSEYENSASPDATEYGLSLEELQQRVSQLQDDLAAMEQKAATNWDLLLRSKAEQENLRKRAKLDVDNAHKYAVEKFAFSMLHVVDTLERGIESTDAIDPSGVGNQIVKDDDNYANRDNLIKSLKDGMELTLKLFIDSLEHFGVKMIYPSAGDVFNPLHHEALSMQEHDNFPQNSVITVVQKGFMIHDRVLRAAKVIVAKRA